MKVSKSRFSQTISTIIMISFYLVFLLALTIAFPSVSQLSSTSSFFSPVLFFFRRRCVTNTQDWCSLLLHTSIVFKKKQATLAKHKGFTFEWSWEASQVDDPRNHAYAGIATINYHHSGGCKNNFPTGQPPEPILTSTVDWWQLSNVKYFAVPTKHGKCDAHISADLEIRQNGFGGRKMVLHFPDVRFLTIFQKKNQIHSLFLWNPPFHKFKNLSWMIIDLN